MKWIKGIFGEVVQDDCYGLRTLDFNAEIIFDIGSNVGVFTNHARSIFSDARIICVEPNETNRQWFDILVYKDDNITLLPKVIGKGDIFHGKGKTGGMETYLSAGLGYPLDHMSTEPSVKYTEIEKVMPDDLILEYWNGKKSVFKFDCEGCENAFMQHEPSILLLLEMDYVCAELHTYSIHGGLQGEVRETTESFIDRFRQTHTVTMNGVYFTARKL